MPRQCLNPSSGISRDNVDVRVKNELTGGGVVVHADVYAVRRDGFFTATASFLMTGAIRANTSSVILYKLTECFLGIRRA